VLERSARRYEQAADALERRGDLVGAFAPHVTWTSAATHPVLPLLATDAGVRLQLQTGIAAHRARFGAWGGGLWLPECAYAPWLDEPLAETGVHAVCVDFTDLGLDRPLRTAAGPTLVPIDRPTLELVWSEGGYPSRPPYRDSHALTEYRHHAWDIGGAVLRRRGGRAPSPRRRPRLRRSGRAACARSTPSCSATSGTRDPPGWPR
jgi:1,4-alpha-glucan branching enzyme